jgi:hypothetical protein
MLRFIEQSVLPSVAQQSGDGQGGRAALPSAAAARAAR